MAWGLSDEPEHVIARTAYLRITCRHVSIIDLFSGIGRLSVLLIARLYLSDRFGRRPFIILGTACYLIFSWHSLHAQTILSLMPVAFGNLHGQQFLDAGTYPSLMEAFPRSPGWQIF